VDSLGLAANEGGLEEHLGRAEALVSDDDDVAVGELVARFEFGTLSGVLLIF